MDLVQMKDAVLYESKFSGPGYIGQTNGCMIMVSLFPVNLFLGGPISYAQKELSIQLLAKL
jgi:hypothetical protein